MGVFTVPGQGEVTDASASATRDIGTYPSIKRSAMPNSIPLSPTIYNPPGTPIARPPLSWLSSWWRLWLAAPSRDDAWIR